MKLKYVYTHRQLDLHSVPNNRNESFLAQQSIFTMDQEGKLDKEGNRETEGERERASVMYNLP